MSESSAWQELISALWDLQAFDYVGVATMVVICYDYMLTFSREVELIWLKPWSTMSYLFIMTRYLALMIALINGLWSGSGVLYMSPTGCFRVAEQLRYWAEVIWTILMHSMVVLCVAAMFDHPKRTKYILLSLFALVTIQEIVTDFLALGPNSGFSTLDIPEFITTICYPQLGPYYNYTEYSGLALFAFEALLMVLVVYRFAVHSIQMKAALGKHRVNEYMKLLAQSQAVYFAVVVAAKTIGIVMDFGNVSQLFETFSVLFVFTIPFILYPRIVLNFRGHRSASGGMHLGSRGSQSLPLNMSSRSRQSESFGGVTKMSRDSRGPQANDQTY